MTTEFKKTALDWVDDNRPHLSTWNQTIWHYAEPAWREYQSAAWYVNKLRSEGFTVEANSGGMPTAFAAYWSNRPEDGPVIGGYAEYDAIPGNCQAAVPYPEARDGLSVEAAGHTDPHSALGISALGGVLAAKAAMEKHDIPGTLKFFGEPAEKVRGSKPIHAAQGYYDGLDAMISFHPFYMMPLCNTTVWDTHCGAAYSMIYRFSCDEPHTWQQGYGDNPIPQSHATTRAPGANDAVVMMFNLSRMTRESMLPHTGSWSLSETILNAGQATADNLPARRADIQYLLRVPDLASAEKVRQYLDRNAQAVADATHCNWSRHWVSKSRPGLANHAMSELAFQALEEVGPPEWDEQALATIRRIQSRIGIPPMQQPLPEACTRLIRPRDAEAELRQMLPPNQKAFTSDDYTDMCWHTPTARIYIARPVPAAPDGFSCPDWAMNALGGIAATIDPMIVCASKTVALSMLRLLTDGAIRQQAWHEFEERTGGGIGGTEWIEPLADYPPPIHFRWPEYVTTARGRDWWIPAASDNP